jgi:phage terminase large subunit-like protein
MINKDKYPHCHTGHQWAIDVQKNPHEHCLAVRNAVDRYFKDLKKIELGESDYYLDYEKAERYLRLVQKFKHVKGANWKSPYIEYEPWQCFLFMYLMGMMNKSTGRRRFRSAYVQVPRGQGKSALASQMGLYFLSLDKEEGPEVICASTKKEAARIVFDSSRFMALKNQSYLKNTGTEVLAHTITHRASNGIMKPVASDSQSMDGLNPSLIIGDEIHEWKRKLYDVLDSSLTKRDDSLFFMISTAGLSTEGIGHEIYAYSKKVLSGEVEDDTWFSIIWEMDIDDNWQSPEVWKKVNPNWGVSVDPVNFEAKAKKAKETPASKYNFLVKHLNSWQNSHAPFFSVDHFDKCDDSAKLINMRNEKCFLGVDLASKIDLACVSAVFKPDKYVVLNQSWLPEAAMMNNKNAKYERWVEEGHIRLIPGEVIDYEVIEKYILEFCEEYSVLDIMCDPWQAQQMIQNLEKENKPVTEFRMNTSNLSEATKELDAAIRGNNLIHNGSGLFRWCLSNVVCKFDAANNVYPRKESNRLKIDEAISSIMGVAAWINESLEESIYESRGLISF